MNLDAASKALAAERKWFEDRGGSLPGYVAFYAKFGRTSEYAESLYRADADKLALLERTHRELTAR